MVGITIRLPASTLNTARALAAGRGVKVTALIRDWVEQQLADNTDDRRVVSVAELRRLIAPRQLKQTPAVQTGGTKSTHTSGTSRCQSTPLLLLLVRAP